MAKFFCLFFYDAPHDSFNIFIRQCVVHRQTDDFVGHLRGDGEVLGGSTGQAAVGTEGADEGIEIAAAPNALLLHLEIELVASHTVFLGIDENREVTVVMADAGHIIEETDAGNIPQGLAVAVGHLLAGGDGGRPCY